MSTQLLTLTEVAARQEPPCHPITLLRRARKDPAFPQPRKFAGRWFFEACDWESFERRQHGQAA